MSESSANQIEVGSTGSFFSGRGLSLKKVGRKRLLNRDKYLEAVEKVLSTSDIEVGRKLGVDRTTVYRFRKKNPEIVFEAEEYLKEVANLVMSRKYLIYGNFLKIPTIRSYRDIMIRKRVGENKMNAKLRGVWHMCKYLKVHPLKATPEQVADIVNEMRDRKIIGENVPSGLSYLTQREAWRGYFQSVKGISGQILTDLGIDAKPSLGFGRYSRERLNSKQRRDFENALKKVCREMNLSDNHYMELIADAKCMYYSGTRRTAMIEFNFTINRSELEKDIWILYVIDKGRNDVVLQNGKFDRGREWEKIFTGDALEVLKDYFLSRFKMDRETLEMEIPRKITWLFPLFHDIPDKITEIFKKAHKKAGIKTSIPVHIFRHTFAQDCLEATDWNYEIVASLGGWSSTWMLKKAYGEMGRGPKLRGLQKAMGIPVEEIKHELKF